jgi:hypothetical protein
MPSGVPAILQIAAIVASLSAPTQAQVTGTVTVDQLPDLYAVPDDVKSCIWQPGHKDVAYAMGCNTQTVYKVCFCPTASAAQVSASRTIAECMTYW